MPSIAFSEFVRRQTATSEHTSWTLSEEEVLQLTQDHFEEAKEGYRDGVILVPVPPEGFFSPVVILEEGQALCGSFKARREGETPRKSIQADVEGPKTPAVGVDVILYRADVLAEDDDRSSDAEWEVISINARVTEEEQPIAPMTLLANHFQADGGTATGMSPEEFEAALRVSYRYWSNKAMKKPQT